MSSSKSRRFDACRMTRAFTVVAIITLSKTACAEEATAAQRIRVAIYSGEGVTRGDAEQVKSCLPASKGFEVTLITAKEIDDGSLGKYDVLIHPGGSASGQAQALGEEGRDRVRRFVRRGGGYVGICAGAYLASVEYPWALRLMDARVIDDEHWARGVGKVTLHLPNAGQAALGTDAAFTEMHYENGPLLGPAKQQDIPDFEPLATFETEIRMNDAPKGVMQGTTAIARGRYGEGRVVCFSTHPEKSGGCKAYAEEMVRWAAGLAAKVGLQVTLRGSFDGPGKFADYIRTDGGHVYLKGDIQSDANSPNYGTEIVVKGKLQRYSPPPARLPSPAADEAQGAPEHFFIESPELVTKQR